MTAKIAMDGIERCCPVCESFEVDRSILTDKFKYGASENAVTLEADVVMFTCKSCGLVYSGEDAEEARMEAVERHMIGVFPQMCEALLEQHRAIDTLFAMLIAKTMNAEQPFYPSESGQPWGAIQLGKAAIEAAGGRI